uniref:Uncharacterized protein n=1 Tax=Panagrolaimus sp. ES5 TaxID=591445 RepID=A0AC34FSL6_9BILA
MTEARELIILVSGGAEHITVIDIPAEKCDYAVEFGKFDINNFFHKLEHCIINLSQVKAIVFDNFDTNESDAVALQMNRRKCREFCQKHGIFCFCLNILETFTNISVCKIKPLVKENEIVIVGLATDNNCSLNRFLIRKNNSYRILQVQQLSNSSSFSEHWKQEFQQQFPYQCKRLIVVRIESIVETRLIKAITNCFKEIEKVDVILYRELESCTASLMIDTVLHLMNEKRYQFHVDVPVIGVFKVQVGNGTMFVIDESKSLPLKKSITIKCDSQKSIKLFYTTKFGTPFKLIEEIKLSLFKSKKVKITLKIDVNSIYDLKVEPVDDGIQIVKPSSVCVNSRKEAEATFFKIVFEKDSFSTFLGKKSLKDEDGLQKTPLYCYTFQKNGEGEKVFYGTPAKEMLVKFPEAVVYDILQIASISNIDEVNASWKFEFCEENALFLVKMKLITEEDDGKTKMLNNATRMTTVPFLLALLLKNASDRVKKEIGKRMKMVEISFDDDVEVNKTLKKNFIEAGKLYHNIDIEFV